MKCRDCGQEGFATIGEVAKHKRDDCSANIGRAMGKAEANETLELPDGVQCSVLRMTVSSDSVQATTSANGMPEPAAGFIPGHLLPQQWEALGEGQPIRLAVMGRVVRGGVAVDSADWWRRGR